MDATHDEPVADTVQAILAHQGLLGGCRRCPDMIGPVVMGPPVTSPVMLIGQAPGTREGPLGRPFAWTAGRTLFSWFQRIGMNEPRFRSRVYMAAVCRCFPGRNPGGGDRVPSRSEIERCSSWLEREYQLLQPALILPVGKLAIGRFLGATKLAEVVGRLHSIEIAGRPRDLIPLPHPSGASTWHRTEPGIGLLADALQLIAAHPAWKQLTQPADAGNAPTAGSTWLPDDAATDPIGAKPGP